MKRLLVLFFLVATSWSLPNKTDTRIIGGDDAQRRQFPYIVSIRMDNVHHCGGSILTTSWIISASHCWESNEQTPKAVYAGLLIQDEDNPDVQTRDVAETILHPQFDFPYNDVSLLRLATPLIYTAAVQPVGLPCADEVVTGDVWVSGWGRTSVSPSVLPDHLQCLEMTLISVEDCDQGLNENVLTWIWPVLPTQICTIPKVLKQSGCHGDSGGPLVQEGILVGTVVGGDGTCGSTIAVKVPNVFTRVSAFLPFIYERTGLDYCGPTSVNTVSNVPNEETTTPSTGSKVALSSVHLAFMAVLSSFVIILNV